MNGAGFPDYNINGVIPFNLGAPTGVDENGCIWWLDGGIDGWDSPTGRVTMLPRIGNDPLADGEIPADLHYRGRTLKFSLYAECPDETAREKAWYLAAQATDLIDSSGVFYANEEVPKQVTVVRSGNQQQGRLVMLEQGLTMPMAISPPLKGLTPGSSITLLKATFELYCPDPRKYSQTTHFATTGAGSFTNHGNTGSVTATITLTPTGGGTGPITIVVATQTMQLVVPTVPSGPPLSAIPGKVVITLRNRTITDGSGGNCFYLRNLQTPWPVLPPGTHAWGATVPGVITYRDAWI